MPGPPEDLKVNSRNSTSLLMEWKAPDKPNGRITIYEVRIHQCELCVISSLCVCVCVCYKKIVTCIFFSQNTMQSDNEYHLVWTFVS